jgi:dienelactone hydrolase
MNQRQAVSGLFVLFCICGFAAAQSPNWAIKDESLRAYFEAEVAALADRTSAELRSIKDWDTARPQYRRQLADMLGLDPMPRKTDLKATVTGKLDHADFTVEKLHFQSSPGLYVTANLYVPKNLDKPAPAVLYLCGHAVVKAADKKTSLGNKTGYQHHGAWFARNGYVCMLVDTLQLGEIEGIHHGTHREKMWWWLSRGYTPAGVETWNNIRALDYLCTRPEVDKERLGVTGRSGGGAYSWFLGAMDDRVKVAVPVAGITDLRDHVVDGAIEGHCDCMYMFNTYRWDFPMLSALMAPRPLLLANTDKDGIFPLDGVYRIHEQNELLYKKLGAEKNLGLVITEGPHKDTQELQLPAFKWFNRHLKKDESPIVDAVANKLFAPEQLKVFDQLPADQINTKIQEQFVPATPAPAVPESQEQWAKMRDAWMAALKEKTFAGWPASAGAAELKRVSNKTDQGIDLVDYELSSQPHVKVPLHTWTRGEVTRLDRIVINVMEDELAMDKSELPRAAQPLLDENAMVVFVTTARGAERLDERKQTHVRRRYALLGQTVDGMRAYDVRRAVQAVRKLPGAGEKTQITLRAKGPMAGVALYAALFEPSVTRLELQDLPTSHKEGPQLLNVLRIMDVPAAVAMAAERATVVLETADPHAWPYPKSVAAALKWPEDRIQIQPKK